MKRFDLPRLDLAKIDIEGAEAEVFEPQADLSWCGLCMTVLVTPVHALPCNTATTNRLDSADYVVMELHDFMAHFWGRKEVSSNVLAAFAQRGFHNFTDNEHHIFYRDGGR